MPLTRLTDDGAPRERIADWVYNRLRHEILSGGLAANEWLSVPALASELGVSRSPVREAVQRLVQERLAVDKPRHGAVVAQVDGAALGVLYEVREVLEGLAARLAAECAPHHRQALECLHAEHRAAVDAGDREQHLALDQRFHRLIRDAAGNPWLAEYLEQIQSQVGLAMLTTSVSAGPQRAIEDHERILRSICAGDGDAAELAARQHIARLRAALPA